MSDKLDWRNAMSPSFAELEALAGETWQKLPEAFRAACGDVLVRVEDFPTDEVLDSLGLESPFDLMGLYHGVSLAHKSVSDVPRGPDMVLLYRRPMLDYWAENEETLGHLVTHVLVHEIGHHLGLSDEDMEAIEAEAGSQGDS